MKCSNCGSEVVLGKFYCPNCGFLLNKKNKKKQIFLGIVIGLFSLGISVFIFSFQKDSRYYFRDHVPKEIEKDEIIISEELCSLKEGTVNVNKSSSITSIISDNTYSCANMKEAEMANRLIQEDSSSQKDGCSQEILDLEERISEKYGITAVNLCEMDISFAMELEKVFDKIYKEYPAARGYLTNVTLKNESISRNGVIASFSPIFHFADIESSDYQLIIKTQMFLSASYFLNPERLKSATYDASTSGHFPPNATIYSPVAHEMGHYLSFIALLKSYDIDSILLINEKNYYQLSEIGIASKTGDFSRELIEEAYQECVKDKATSLSIDEWRGLISNYALAKDNSGDYIYDETIAEAFHDVYLNGDNAAIASRYIVSVLKERLQ